MYDLSFSPFHYKTIILTQLTLMVGCVVKPELIIFRNFSVAQLDMCPTGDQEVAGSTPTSSATFFCGDLIMNYFLLSLSPFH